MLNEPPGSRVPCASTRVATASPLFRAGTGCAPGAGLPCVSGTPPCLSRAPIAHGEPQDSWSDKHPLYSRFCVEVPSAWR